MLFEDWAGIGRVLLAGLLAYAGLVATLRVSGKRTLSKMNAFDLVVTIALGSCLATVILSRDTPLAEGLAGLAVLIGLQYLVAWASLRSARVRDLVKSSPALLLHRGRMLPAALRRERVTEEEVLAALRSHGVADPAGIGAVVLETDGSMTVIRSLPESGDGTLRGLG